MDKVPANFKKQIDRQFLVLFWFNLLKSLPGLDKGTDWEIYASEAIYEGGISWRFAFENTCRCLGKINLIKAYSKLNSLEVSLVDEWLGSTMLNKMRNIDTNTIKAPKNRKSTMTGRKKEIL